MPSLDYAVRFSEQAEAEHGAEACLADRTVEDLLNFSEGGDDPCAADCDAHESAEPVCLAEDEIQEKVGETLLFSCFSGYIACCRLQAERRLKTTLIFSGLIQRDDMQTRQCRKQMDAEPGAAAAAKPVSKLAMLVVYKYH